jgi:hypothetical protein
LYVDGVNAFDKWSWNPKAHEKIPGLSFNSKRTQIVAAFEEALRHNFVVRSTRLINEMNTFVYINGKADHMKGHHDDLIMAMAMCIYVGEFSFSLLKKSEESTKALLDGWAVSERPMGGNERPVFNQLPNYDPLRNVKTQNYRNGRTPGVNDYMDHSWLFGGNSKR